MDDKLRKKLGVFTILLATPYVGLIIYYIISLFIAYGIQKEECPMGFIVLPYFIYPAIFISWLRFYLGSKFIKNYFNFRNFIRYTVWLLIIESMFWTWQYFKLLHLKLVLIYLPIFLLINCYILKTYFSRKVEEKIINHNNFYLGIDIIRFIDILQGSVFAFLMIPSILFSFKSFFWIKEFPLEGNIYNLGITFLIFSLIYPYFWIAFNIKKFHNKCRIYQIFVSAIAIGHSFIGSPLFLLMPIHLFIIVYLNFPTIRKLFLRGSQAQT
ncbi:MAG: hypothetical protein AB1755_06655 [Candidatus Omnitrophota bacterium]